VAYSAQADVQSAAGGAVKLRQLSDWTNTGAIDATEVSNAIAEADGMIDGYANKIFHVPFNPVPEIIKRKSAQIAKLLLARRRGAMTQEETEEWSELTSSDESKPGWLLQLAKGIVTPGGDPLPAKHGTMATDNTQSTLPTDRDHSRDKLSGYW
jgi:phage gp36-like protein